MLVPDPISHGDDELVALAEEWLKYVRLGNYGLHTGVSGSPGRRLLALLQDRGTCIPMTQALLTQASSDEALLEVIYAFHEGTLNRELAADVIQARALIAGVVKQRFYVVRHAWNAFYPAQVYAALESGAPRTESGWPEPFNQMNYQAQKWTEYWRAIEQGEEVLDETGASQFVFDAFFDLPTGFVMLEALWAHARSERDYECVLDRFHSSMRFRFHPDVVSEERQWITSNLTSMSPRLQECWAELDADQLTDQEWEESAHRFAEGCGPDPENAEFVEELLRMSGIDPRRINEFWPATSDRTESCSL